MAPYPLRTATVVAYLLALCTLHPLQAEAAVTTLCDSATVGTAQTLSTGSYLITGCSINAAITLDGEVTLQVVSSTTSIDGKIICNHADAVLDIDASTIGGDIDLIKGTVTVDDSTVKDDGRILGTGSGYTTATLETSLTMTFCTFSPTTLVVNQIHVTFTGAAPALGHSWTFNSCFFKGAGGVVFDTLRMAAITFHQNDFTDLELTPGSITTAIHILKAGTIEIAGGVGETLWYVRFNRFSSATNVATTGGVALLKLGTLIPAAGTVSSHIDIRVSYNTGFAQLVQGATSLTTTLPCTSSTFEFRQNTGTISGVPDDFSVFDFESTEYTGCPILIVSNVYTIAHTDTSATTGVVSFVTHPSQSTSSSDGALTVRDNTVAISAVGDVDVSLSAFKSSTPGYYSVATTITENIVGITSTDGRGILVYIDGSTVSSIITVSLNTGETRSSAVAAVLGSSSTAMTIGAGTVQFSENSLAIVCPATGTVSIASGDTVSLIDDDAVLRFTSNEFTFSTVPVNLLSFTVGGISLTQGTVDFSYNSILGCSGPQRVMPAVYTGTGNAHGCDNRICGERIQTLRTETSGWVWQSCLSDTTTQSNTPTPTLPPQPTATDVPTFTPHGTPTLAPTAIPSTTIMPIPTTSLEPPSHTRTKLLPVIDDFNATTTPSTPAVSPPTTEPPKVTPTTVTATAGVGTIVGSAAFVDSASTIQLTAMLSLMACQTDGADSKVARLILNPFGFSYGVSGNLIGSFVLLGCIVGLYFLVVAIVFWCVRRWGPVAGSVQTNSDDNHRTLYTEESAGAEIERRIFSAKMYLFYPRLPVLVGTLLFPGIVFECCSLLYGNLSSEASIWEKLIAAAGIIVAILFIVYHHIVAVCAKKYSISKAFAYAVADEIYTKKTLHTDDNIDDDHQYDVMMQPVVIVTPQALSDASHNSNYVSLESPRLVGPYQEQQLLNLSGNHTTLVRSFISADATMMMSGGGHLSSPSNGYLSLSGTPQHMRSILSPFSDVGGNEEGGSAGSRFSSTTSSVGEDAPTITVGGLRSVREGDQRMMMVAEQSAISRMSSISSLPSSPSHPTTPSSAVLFPPRNIGLIITDAESLSAAAPTEYAANNNDDFASSLGFSGEDPMPSGQQQQQQHDSSNKYTTPRNHQDNSPTIKNNNNLSDPHWFVTYTDDERALQHYLVRMLLLAEGYWSNVVGRSLYCIVSPFRPSIVPWMAAHNLWRMLLMSAVAAITPRNMTAHCVYVQGAVVAICILHGISIYLTRVFRIPVLNPLQGTQSVLLGLLACAPFISDTDAQSGFSNTLLALSLLTVLVSIAAILLEVRLQRRHITIMQAN